MGLSLGKLQEIVKDWEAWRASVQVCGVTKSWTWLTEQLNNKENKAQLGEISLARALLFS